MDIALRVLIDVSSSGPNITLPSLDANPRHAGGRSTVTRYMASWAGKPALAVGCEGEARADIVTGEVGKVVLVFDHPGCQIVQRRRRP
jgi:hypothetical protein